MKTMFKSIPIIIVIVAFTFAACSNGLGESATLTLDIGAPDASASKAVNVGDLRHTIVLSGPTGTKTLSLTGAGRVSTSVVAGNWNIRVSAYYEGALYATGSASVTVKAGVTTSITVQMSVIFEEPQGGGGGGGGGSTTGGSSLSSAVLDSGISGDGGFLSPLTCVVGNTIYAFIEGPDDLIWVWKLDDDIIPASKINTYNEYTVEPGDVHKKITATASHLAYNGSVTLGPMYVCDELISAWVSTVDANLDGFYVLQDISPTPYNLSSPAPIGATSTPPDFNGYFDGNGQTLNISSLSQTGINNGLFAVIGEDGIVKNFNVSPSSPPFVIHISPSNNDIHNTGSIAGINRGLIMNVSIVEPDIENQAISTSLGARTGGIAGHNLGRIKNCSVLATIAGISIRGEDWAFHLIGGIAGLNENEISFCWTDNDVQAGVGGGTGSSGGIAGGNTGSITNNVVLGANIDGVSPGSAGRIWGEGSGTGGRNYGEAGVNVDGAALSPGAGTFANNHGEDVNSPLPETWWDSQAAWETVWGGDEETPWVWDAILGWPILWF